ncbi:MAG: amidohydrolase family protein [Acidimicrobiia bacterium]
MTRSSPDDPVVPFAFHPLSNGEYAPLPRSELVTETVRRTLELAETNARRLGISRRQFLRSTCGMAATLTTLAACSREQSASQSGTTSTTGSGSTSSAPGGTFTLPPESTIDETAATTVLGASAGELVVDVQTHLLEYPSGSSPGFGLGFPQASCGDDPVECLGIDAWLALVLGGSDTTVAVLSAVPVIADPDPLSTEVMERARRQAEELGCLDRVLIQGHATPTTGPLPAALEAMAQTAADFELAAWKAYTHAGPPWRLDDDTGNAFCDQVRALGQRIICVHKGLGPAAASPADVGPAARNHPDLSFCIYHSGFETAVTEGPYPGDDAGAASGGVDRLIASVRTAGIGPAGNVYAELGSTWWNLVQRPDEAAHVLGKLLVAFGPDNILWGTDSLWYGSPQAQIEAFRAFEITTELQEQYGYPAPTAEVKRKILGLNAARLYGVDPTLTRCQPAPVERAAFRAHLPDPAPRGPTTAAGARAVFAAEHPWFRR